MRRRRVAFTRGDVLTLLLGAAFSISMLGFLTWSFVENVRADRAVTANARAPEAPR